MQNARTNEAQIDLGWSLMEVAMKTSELAKSLRDSREAKTPEDRIGWDGELSYMRVLPLEFAEDQLRSFLASQPAEVIYMLIAIMYLGRGDVKADVDMQQWCGCMEVFFEEPEWAIGQMMGQASLPEYLEEGLARLRQVGRDVNRLLETKTNRKKSPSRNSE